MLNELATKLLEFARQEKMTANDARKQAARNWGFAWQQAWLQVANQLGA